jgi:hypothetical protein
VRRGSDWAPISVAIKANASTTDTTGPVSLELEREVPAAGEAAAREAPSQKPPGPLFPKSPLARTIQNLLIKKPEASAREICFMLDDMEDPPKLRTTWKSDPKDRSFVDAYKSPKRGLIDRFVSRVRRCMMKHKIL